MASLDPQHGLLDRFAALALLDAMPDAVLIVDRSGEIVFANTQATGLLAVDDQELAGRSVEELVPADVRGAHRAHRTRYQADPIVRSMGSGLLLRARRTDGSEFPVEISLSPLRVGLEDFTVAALRDVTERIDGEDYLRRVLATLDASDDAMFIFDAETLHYSYVNQGAVRMVGYDHDELTDMTPLHLNPTASVEGYRSLVTSLLADPEHAIVREATLVGKDGTEVPVEKTFHVGPVGRDGSRWIVVLARDIRARLAAEEELRASQAALRDAEQVLVLAEDRERIARDLHDTVIQRLFGAGLQLQATMAGATPEVGARIEGVVSELDETIKELRNAIFALQGRGARPPGVRGRLFDAVTNATAALGFEPRLELAGEIESLDDALVDNLVAVIREALANVARHARASAVRVSVVADTDAVVTVVDNGKGLPEQVLGGRGLDNLRRRAIELGGELDLKPGPEGGSRLRWSAPTAAPGDAPRGSRSP